MKRIVLYFRSDNFLCGIRLFSSDGTLLLSTNIGSKEISVTTELDDDERIIGFRSTSFSNEYPAFHKNF